MLLICAAWFHVSLVYRTPLLFMLNSGCHTTYGSDTNGPIHHVGLEYGQPIMTAPLQSGLYDSRPLFLPYEYIIGIISPNSSSANNRRRGME